MSEVVTSIEAPGQTAGTLEPGVLPGLLREIYVNRRTGMLHLTREDERGTICFIRGSIVFGGANIAECRMGETFVRHRLLTAEQLEQALEASRGPSERLGQALLELGFMDRAGLDQALALHVREILLSVFSWADGTYAFEEQDPESLEAFNRPLPLSTAEVILDAVWSIPDSGVIHEALGDLDRVLRPARSPLLRFQRVGLTPDDGFLLSRIDEVLTAREIIDIAPTSREEAERSLFGLLSIGMVEVAPTATSEPPACADGEPLAAEEPTPASGEADPPSGADSASETAAKRRAIEEAHVLAGRDHFEVLGVSREASPAEIKSAYFRLVRTFHPDAQHDPALSDLRHEVEAIFSRVNDAYEVLADPKRRAAYASSLRGARRSEPPTPPPSGTAARPDPDSPLDPVPERGRVETVLDEAEKQFAEGEYWEALRLAQSIVPDAEGSPRQKARLLVARAYLKYPGHAGEAEAELRAVVQEDHRNAEALRLLGKLYEADGHHERAQMMLRRAKALEPGPSPDREGDAAKEAPRHRGLLGRLFGGS